MKAIDKAIDNLPVFLDAKTIYTNPIFFPRRKKLKGWQKEMRRNNPKRFWKGKRRK